jgi:hypothetical protein
MMKDRAKANAARRAARAANPEKARAARMADYYRYREREMATARAYKAANRAKLNAAQRLRNAADPAYNAYARSLRRAAEKQARPAWANLFFMEETYRLARLRSEVTGFKWHVDHIVPLKAKLASGLHSHTNLSVIPASANRIKKNSFHV